MFIFNLETEKVALMPPTSPCLSSSVVNTNQRQKSKPMRHYLSNDNETSSSSPEQLRDHRSNISIISRHHQTKFDTAHHHYFSPSELRTPVSFRKKIHDIYVLPVSPDLSSSSSTTNTDEIIRTNSNTMPIQSRRDIHNNSTFHGIKNDCFTESPQSKNRTLPRLHAGTLRRVPPPSQPPPLPPIISPFHEDKSSFQHQVSAVNLEENQMKKPHPPPVPYRSQKPSRLPISFEELTKQSDFRFQIESSPQNDYAEHAWPNPPESMSTSQLSGPLSIPYDHLVPNIVMHQNNTTTFFHQYRPNEHSMLTESDT